MLFRWISSSPHILYFDADVKNVPRYKLGDQKIKAIILCYNNRNNISLPRSTRYKVIVMK